MTRIWIYEARIWFCMKISSGWLVHTCLVVCSCITWLQLPVHDGTDVSSEIETKPKLLTNLTEKTWTSRPYLEASDCMKLTKAASLWKRLNKETSDKSLWRYLGFVFYSVVSRLDGELGMRKVLQGTMSQLHLLEEGPTILIRLVIYIILCHSEIL